ICRTTPQRCSTCRGRTSGSAPAGTSSGPTSTSETPVTTETWRGGTAGRGCSSGHLTEVRAHGLPGSTGAASGNAEAYVCPRTLGRWPALCAMATIPFVTETIEPKVRADTASTEDSDADRPLHPEMVRVAGGTFLMGSDHHYPEERPVHP